MTVKKQLEQLEELKKVVVQLELIGEYEVAEVARQDIAEYEKELKAKDLPKLEKRKLQKGFIL